MVRKRLLEFLELPFEPPKWILLSLRLKKPDSPWHVGQKLSVKKDPFRLMSFDQMKLWSPVLQQRV